jgi:hypothetical protein
MSGTIIKLPGIHELDKSAPKGVRSIMDTMELTPKGVRAWKKPPFQRDLRVNDKVQALVEEIRQNDGVLPGILTLGKLDGDIYIVDGQHRAEAFLLSECLTGYADVRICTFDSMSEMAEEFRLLNSALVRMRNDDILRSMEYSYPNLAVVRRRCPFVGYGHVRIGTGKIVVAMAATIRTWIGSDLATPSTGPSSPEAAKALTDQETKRLCDALTMCFQAWGSDPNNYRLWGTLNLALTFWLWRRLVLGEHQSNRQRGGLKATTLTPEQFMRCLMSESANSQYIAWLVGRALRDRDRSSCYRHVKNIFSQRIREMGIGRAILPQPEWAAH